MDEKNKFEYFCSSDETRTFYFEDFFSERKKGSMHKHWNYFERTHSNQAIVLFSLSWEGRLGIIH